MTDTPGPPAFPVRTVRVAHDAGGLELHFPALRTPHVALGLGTFGLIASVAAAFAAAALWRTAFADTAGMVVAILVAGIVAPIMVFGVAFMGLAVYMLCNALTLQANAEWLTTTRTVCGIVVRRRRLAAHALLRIQAEIPTRHQSPFAGEPIYQLVAIAGKAERIVVAESLRGERQMTTVKRLIEDAVKATDRR